jgi:hypothetical protein
MLGEAAGEERIAGSRKRPLPGALDGGRSGAELAVFGGGRVRWSNMPVETGLADSVAAGVVVEVADSCGGADRPSRSRISRLKRMMASSPSRLSSPAGLGAGPAFSSRLRLPPRPPPPPKASVSSPVRVRPLRLPPFSRPSEPASARIHAGVSSSSSPPRRRRSPRSLRSPRSRAGRSSSEPTAGAGFQAGRPGAVRPPPPPSRRPFDEDEARIEEDEPLGRVGLEGRPAAVPGGNKRSGSAQRALDVRL